MPPPRHPHPRCFHYTCSLTTSSTFSSPNTNFLSPLNLILHRQRKLTTAQLTDHTRPHLRCLTPPVWNIDNEYSPSTFELSRIMNVPSYTKYNTKWLQKSEERPFLTFEYFLSLVSDLFLSKLPWYQVCPTGEPWGMALGGRLGMICASSGVCRC